MKSRKCEHLLFVGLGFWAYIFTVYSLNSSKSVRTTPKQNIHEVSNNLNTPIVAFKMFMDSIIKICNKNINKQLY